MSPSSSPRARGSGTRRKEGRDKAARDWRDETLSRLREIIVQADPAAIEERKWKKPSRPEGVPVWSHDGIICVADTLKSAVRLTFFRGAQLADPTTLFNARLDSRTVRAIDVHEGEPIRAAALGRIVRAAASLNSAKSKRR